MPKYEIEFYGFSERQIVEMRRVVIEASTAADALTMFEVNYPKGQHPYTAGRTSPPVKITLIAYPTDSAEGREAPT